ncbi:MAG: hypothetical protein NTW08_01365 [Gammaproteobacteria bacterium]|nr:hypothetical protein [Gammaproteobacteria bacterium]
MAGFLNKTIHQQGALILNRPRYAYALIALLAALPLLTWLSVSIMALITLRKGAQDGIKAANVGMAGLLLLTLLTASLNGSNLFIIAFTFLPCFLMAWLLRVTSTWKPVCLFLITLASLLVCVFHFYPPTLLVVEYQELHTIMQHLQGDGLKLPSWLVDKPHMLAYLLGVQSLSFILSTLTALMLARAMQAKLFYPDGFKKEMLSLQIYPWATIPFLLVMIGLYQHNALALCLTPIWILYMASAGLSVLICIFAPHRVVITLFFLLLATALLPIVFLPLIIIAGISDSFLHLRTRYCPTHSANHP